MASGETTANSPAYDDTRTPAQVYSLVFGATLLLAGILGFFVDSSFETGTNVQGDELILFEVNAWHNLIHIASGLVGLAASAKAKPAFAFALGFGLVYGAVTVWGLIAGDNLTVSGTLTGTGGLGVSGAGAGA